jgi:hypothetical protein
LSVDGAVKDRVIDNNVHGWRALLAVLAAALTTVACAGGGLAHEV